MEAAEGFAGPPGAAEAFQAGATVEIAAAARAATLIGMEYWGLTQGISAAPITPKLRGDGAPARLLASAVSSGHRGTRSHRLRKSPRLR